MYDVIIKQILFRPLSWVYGLVVSLRGWLYDQGFLRRYVSAIPVVSIGNLTAGGNGKTPLCLYTAQELKARGYRPVILSRGYGGKARGPQRVSSIDTPVSVGDEAVMMFESGVAPVYVALSRAAGAVLIERDQAGDVIVLDDGFQHRALERDVDIVSINAGSSTAVEAFCRGELLPLGRFRENRASGLKRADIVVVSERRVVDRTRMLEPVDNRLLSLLPESTTVYRATLEAVGMFALVSREELKAPRSVVAVAAIANPEGFFCSLRELGFEVVESYPFPDHHSFSEVELRRISDRYPDVPIVCTVKDGVKIKSLSEEIAGRCAALEVSARVTPSDAFAVHIVRLLQGRT